MCGVGSIGKRHLRNLKDVLSERNEAMRVDFVRKNENSNDLEIAYRTLRNSFGMI